tara:strand:- start:7758 stop:8357 length:600 start_codon:yes stop_codon:yes gene_type:complete
MKQFLSSQFSHFEKDDINPGTEIKEALFVFCAWALPAFGFVLWANKYYPDVEFYQSAISEGVGPNLWNAIGAFGFFSFGIAIVLSKLSLPAKVARHILSNTYAIGCLTFGLIVGQWCILIFNQELVWWHRGLFGVTSGFLLVIVFLYNLIVWYMYYLIKNDGDGKSPFLVKLEQMNFLWRLFIGLVVALLITVIFLSER